MTKNLPRLEWIKGEPTVDGDYLIGFERDGVIDYREYRECRHMAATTWPFQRSEMWHIGPIPKTKETSDGRES